MKPPKTRVLQFVLGDAGGFELEDGALQKLACAYAIENDFELLVFLRGNGHNPEQVSQLLDPLFRSECDAIFACRKGSRLAMCCSSLQAYCVQALRDVPFQMNSSGAEFSAELLVQLEQSGKRLATLSVGDTPLLGTLHALRNFFYLFRTSLIAWLQTLEIFYDRRFDFHPDEVRYQPKFGFDSSHRRALEAISPGERLLILGCGSAELVEPFIDKGGKTALVDFDITNSHRALTPLAFEADLNTVDLRGVIRETRPDTILALDVVEHLHSPETFLESLRNAALESTARVIISVPNVAFFPVRLMLLFGMFHYGRKGILDLTHTRLFTFRSLTRLLNETGFTVEHMSGIPAPFPLALGSESRLAKILLRLNQLGIPLSRGLFSYQCFALCSPLPTPAALRVQSSRRHTLSKIAA